MVNSLYQWCLDKQTIHPELKFNCESLDDGTIVGEGEDFLLGILTKEASTLEEDDLNIQIAEKRRLVSDLEALLKEKDYVTQERKMQELQKLDKKYYNQFLTIIILLVTAILMGIVITYNLFF
jgi:hypothetical protein